jgi:hypothetical protein
MKMLVLAAATMAAVASPAFAGIDQTASSQGHYEWSAPHQFGPRAPLQASRRIWVPDRSQMANCDCKLMKTSVADCTASMHGMASPPSAPVAG